MSKLEFPAGPTAAQQKALDFAQQGPKQLLIGGRWVPARSGLTLDVFNPSTQELLAPVAVADRADVDDAVKAARQAFEARSWSGISPHARTRFLLRIADLVERNAEELATLETLNNGMPIGMSTALTTGAVDMFRYYAGWPTKVFGATNPSEASAFIYTLREPVGVCGLIVPWNVPFYLAVLKIAPALACGNTVVLKPDEQTPLSVLRLGELLQEAGLPDGVLNIVPGLGPVAGAAIAAHPDIDKVSFTGSTAVGRQVLQASSGNLKKLTLELGGKSPNIIFPDADLDRAMETAVRAFCTNAGQVCSSGTRVFVHEHIYEQAVDRMTKIAAGYTVGSPLDPAMRMGPLVSQKQFDRVADYIASGLSEGARLTTGGSRARASGYFMQPTVFADVTNGMRIAREEIFGPVGSIISFKDEDDAVLQGNDTDYGLAAAVWTRDIGRAHRVARALKSGRVWINTYSESDAVMTSGGYKQSGLGREQGAESIEMYTNTKSVFVRL